MFDSVYSEIKALSQKDKIPFYTHFFRAETGDICEGDKLLAIKVPEIRKKVKKYYNELSYSDIALFLQSEYNEMRFFGQQVVRLRFEKAKENVLREELHDFLASHVESINHWNLVDTSTYVFATWAIETNNFDLISDYSQSDSVWKKRISIIAGLYFIKSENKEYTDFTIKTLTKHRLDTHEYIQKAIGWVLRDLGKKDEKALISFLQTYWYELAGVTKSYATEKLRKTYDIKTLFTHK